MVRLRTDDNDWLGVIETVVETELERDELDEAEDDGESDLDPELEMVTRNERDMVLLTVGVNVRESVRTYVAVVVIDTDDETDSVETTETD
jgi:hypothetical protein